MQQRPEFTARYFVETSESIEKAAETIAGEQSSGTFMALPGETLALKERSRARVTRIDLLPGVLEPTLQSAFVERHPPQGIFNRAEIEIAFPIDNVGANISSVLATVAGNLFELGEITGLRLLDIDMPNSFAAQFYGPKFGIAGTRALAGVESRPMIGTIVKPSIGLTAAQTASLVDSLCAADIDFIKDDELLADPPYAPFATRLAAVMPVLLKHANRVGRMPMYAFNISGSMEQMLQRHDAVLAAGGSCVMVSANWVGFSAVEHLRQHTQLPIHAHRNGWGALTRHPQLGFSFAAYQKIWRLAGIDHMHVNGVRSKFWEADDSVMQSAKACLAPFAGIRPVMPVFSSAQWAGQAPAIYSKLGSTDLMHLAGGGIIGHPGGIAAGVASMREGWEAAVQGIELETFARDHPALKAAMAQFGAT